MHTPSQNVRESQRRILICEDNNDLVMLMRLALKLEEYQVESLTSMETVVEKTREFRPHLILMDLRMPNISGKEAVELLRQHRDTAAIPTVLVSANAQVGEIAEELGLPYLVKPFHIKELRQMVGAQLKQPAEA